MMTMVSPTPTSLAHTQQIMDSKALHAEENNNKADPVGFKIDDINPSTVEPRHTMDAKPPGGTTHDHHEHQQQQHGNNEHRDNRQPHQHEHRQHTRENRERHRQRNGRRPSNYTASYTPSPSLVQLAADRDRLDKQQAASSSATSSPMEWTSSSAVSGVSGLSLEHNDEEEVEATRGAEGEQRRSYRSHQSVSSRDSRGSRNSRNSGDSHEGSHGGSYSVYDEAVVHPHGTPVDSVKTLAQVQIEYHQERQRQKQQQQQQHLMQHARDVHRRSSEKLSSSATSATAGSAAGAVAGHYSHGTPGVLGTPYSPYRPRTSRRHSLHDVSHGNQGHHGYHAHEGHVQQGQRGQQGGQHHGSASSGSSGSHRHRHHQHEGSSPRRHSNELTEQQIAEYAGKRALLRLEQEFRSEASGAGSSNGIYDGQRLNNGVNGNGDRSPSVDSKGNNRRSMKDGSKGRGQREARANTNAGGGGVVGVMDRRKLARVPQVNKRDLVIGEYLGRGNFCDVFEVTWVPPEQKKLQRKIQRVMQEHSTSWQSMSTSSSDSGSCSLNSSMQSIHEDHPEDHPYDGEIIHQGDLEKEDLDALALSCSNDLRPVFDLGQRRSVSQITTAVRHTSSLTRSSKYQTSIQTGGVTSSASPGSPYSSIRNPNVLALKCLRPAVRAQPRKFVIGAEDLAHETALLACLDHPNIIQLYGRAEGCFSTAFQSSSPSSSQQQRSSRDNDSDGDGSSSEGYFIILDRLMATLTTRIDEWKNECRCINGVIVTDENFTRPQETTLREHLYKRLKVAYCIADALEYLHSCHVVFRDLKPANVGFDSNDCVKMFDFGFATSIAPYMTADGRWYRERGEGGGGMPCGPGSGGGYGPLTETCGTRRYMAPEVALKLGYGKEVDVYSFGMLLWEICALEKPFDSIQSVEAFHDRVVLCGKRPPLHIDPLWTSSLKALMVRCWSTDPLDRPSMMQVKSMLCNVLRDMNVSEMELKKEGNGGNAAIGGGGSGRRGEQGQCQGGFLNKRWRRRLTIG